MKLKFPTYITQKELIKTNSLFKDIRKKQGFYQAKFFRKLAITAAYGTMYKHKISYSDFLNNVDNYVNIDHCQMQNFWNIQEHINTRPHNTNTIFYVTEKTLAYGTLNDVETEIINHLKQVTLKDIKRYQEYKNFFQEFLKDK